MTTSIFTLAFWRLALERAIKTTGQAAAALLVGNGTGLLDTDWTSALSVAGMAGVISLLTSIGSDALTKGTGPSLVSEELHTGNHRNDRGASDVQAAGAWLVIGALTVAVYAALARVGVLLLP